MKSKIILLLALAAISCGDFSIDSATFESPQPEEHSDEKGIPSKLFGDYLSLDDSSKLTITKKYVIRYTVEDFSQKIDSVDMQKIKHDTAYSVVDHKTKFDVKVQGDSALQRWTYYDTLYDVSRGDILRKYKGYYFLNKKISAGSWRVKTLTRIKNGLTLGTISTENDIKKLREITGTKSDSIYSFRPTKKELRRFLKENGFNHKDTYLKIK